MYEVVYYYHGRRNSVVYNTSYAEAKRFWNYIRQKSAVTRAELIVQEAV
jgi:hypothetical protein